MARRIFTIVAIAGLIAFPLSGLFVLARELARAPSESLVGFLCFNSLVGFAFFFYWLRCKHRTLYGALEIFFALVLMYVGLFPAQTHALLVRGPTHSEIVIGAVTKFVTLFGAVYVFVRGLDNIDALQRWNRLTQRILGR
jgi:hypothetical protein